MKVGLAPNSINDPNVDTYILFKGSRYIMNTNHPALRATNEAHCMFERDKMSTMKTVQFGNNPCD